MEFWNWKNKIGLNIFQGHCIGMLHKHSWLLRTIVTPKSLGSFNIWHHIGTCENRGSPKLESKIWCWLETCFPSSFVVVLGRGQLSGFQDDCVTILIRFLFGVQTLIVMTFHSWPAAFNGFEKAWLCIAWQLDIHCWNVDDEVRISCKLALYILAFQMAYWTR